MTLRITEAARYAPTQARKIKSMKHEKLSPKHYLQTELIFLSVYNCIRKVFKSLHI